MNIARCMLRKCENCRYERSCFRKDVEGNEYSLQKKNGANSVRKESKEE